MMHYSSTKHVTGEWRRTFSVCYARIQTRTKRTTGASEKMAAANEADAAAASPYALEVSPESSLQFILQKGGNDQGESSTPKCTMNLKHTGATKEHLAFKVKTTQPRRYLVRPNQGLIAPGGSETVSIILVEKDKQLLLQSYDRLGQSALDHSKDKFLVQSTAVSDEFSSRYSGQMHDGSKTSKELAEALTSMWNSSGGGSASPIINKKLHVKHVVVESSSAMADDGRGTNAALATKLPPPPAMDSMSPEQMFAEVSNLRRKYDELVAFSVNLTAERDILNNTLEQTKRDLNREMALRASLENRVDASGSARAPAVSERKSGGFKLTLIQVLVVALACFLMGLKMGAEAEDERLKAFSFMIKKD